jgi:hypothetical protein
MVLDDTYAPRVRRSGWGSTLNTTDNVRYAKQPPQGDPGAVTHTARRRRVQVRRGLVPETKPR